MIQAKYHNGIYLCFLSGRMDIEQSATHLETVLLSEVQTSRIKSAFTTSIGLYTLCLLFPTYPIPTALSTSVPHPVSLFIPMGVFRQESLRVQMRRNKCIKEYI